MNLRSLFCCASSRPISEPAQMPPISQIDRWLQQSPTEERDCRLLLSRLITDENHLTVSANDIKPYIEQSKISSLPNGLTIEGNLTFIGCDGLRSLPNNLRIHGDLRLDGCRGLTTLPPDIQIEGSLYLSSCVNLISLPDNLRIQGDLDLFGCGGLTFLPHNLQVQGSLSLVGCTRLTFLPTSLQVQQNIVLSGCTGLVSLPDNFQVQGNLYLPGCTRLTSLPDHLLVHGNLYLTECIGLTSLPDHLQIHGNLYLGRCTNITSLPNNIVTWGRCQNGNTRNVFLEGSGISREFLSRIGEPEGMVFHFSMPNVEVTDFKALTTAINFWKGEASTDIQIDPSKWALDLTSKNHFTSFLSKLKGTADYENINSRKILAKRVIQTLEAMDSDKSIRKTCIERAYEAVTSCGDRVILMMNQMELAVRVHTAEKNGSEDLEELALGLARLEVIHEHAAKKVKSLIFVDEIEVYLAYEMELAKNIKLPISTQNMLYRGCAGVNDGDLALALSEAEQITKESKSYTNFLNSWEPWKKHGRKLAIKDLQNRIPISSQPSIESVCPITQEAIKHVIFLEGTPYEYEAISNWWVEQGTNPIKGSTGVMISDFRAIDMTSSS